MPERSLKESLAENAVLLIFARISMALVLPAISLITWLGWQYIQNQFDQQESKLGVQQQQIQEIQDGLRDQSSKSHDISTRVTLVENNLSSEARSNSQFRETMILKMDRFDEAIRDMSSALAGLTATLNADRRNEELRMQHRYGPSRN